MKTFTKVFVLVAFGLVSLTAFASDFEESEAPEIDTVSDKCVYEKPEKEVFAADFVSVRRKLKLDENEKFTVKAFIKNTGNTPWFSDESGCEGPQMSLGTDHERDHDSIFYSDNGDWKSPNRLRMDQERVDPGEIASFSFEARAFKIADIYKQYLTPMLEGITWLDDAGFGFEIVVGDPEDDQTALRKKLLYAGVTGSVNDLDLNAEKQIMVDLSEQKAKLVLGGKIVREFTVSTGARLTPTPTGTYSIKLKQDIRVGGKKPHYIMPKFMWFKDGGYGFHALPSLRTDGGQFWTEAREHIGIPVSHGCIRMLPEDADFAFEFADLGTKVVINS